LDSKISRASSSTNSANPVVILLFWKVREFPMSMVGFDPKLIFNKEGLVPKEQIDPFPRDWEFVKKLEQSTGFDSSPSFVSEENWVWIDNPLEEKGEESIIGGSL